MNIKPRNPRIEPDPGLGWHGRHEGLTWTGLFGIVVFGAALAFVEFKYGHAILFAIRARFAH